MINNKVHYLSWRKNEYVYTEDGKVHTSGWVFKHTKDKVYTTSRDLTYFPVWMKQ